MNTIADLFEKDIKRDINGVIKVAQLDEKSIKQELEEYVITKELNGHFHTFFERYTEALGQVTDKMGIWISGFFGSGKSHFLKIIAYLLENRLLGEKNALDYFGVEKIQDAMLRANMAKSARSETDVILFNIDSKADSTSKNHKDAIVKVFQRVFDDYLGYFGTEPAIAELERQLDQQGHYEAFKREFQEVFGEEWLLSRDAWGFCQDEIAKALQHSMGMSEEAAWRLIDIKEQNYSLSVEKFAKTVKSYLDTQGNDHRILFLVDEVGQYIGENSDLMLNLQTVVEDLGVHCQGKAWVIVTSQEAMDEITKNKIKGKDFSKIVGRFGRPLTLSSANTDEVIKLRLLEKKEVAKASLSALYCQKEAVLRNQINFTSDCASLPGYKDEQDFISTYPFIPYQFNLLQKVFTQIRLMGAAGKHLSEGERSLLDGFQLAAKAVTEKELGCLVPFHFFYRAVEGFLDGGIRRVIDQAEVNPNLQPFDLDLLKTLFMIKYVKEISANAENLTTISLSQIDQGRLQLKEIVIESLNRLEQETLIQRIGDNFTFLTHEEQDIGREIKNIDINPSDIAKTLQTMVWDTLFTDKKFRYDKRHDYGFNRKLDEQTTGYQTNDFGLHILTPYFDRYRDLSNDTQCCLETTDGKEIMVRLPDDERLLDELNEYVKTETYLNVKHSRNITPTADQIIAQRRTENANRKDRLQKKLADLISRADVFACGNKVEVNRHDYKRLIYDGFTYLIDNVYTKLNYIDSGFESEQDITHALVREHQEQNIEGKAFNSAAQQEMQTWLNDEAKAHRQVTIKAIIDKFNARPYGWAELDTLGVMAELVNQGKLEIRHAQGGVNYRESGFVAKLRTKKGLTEYTVRLGEIINPTSLKVAKDLATELLTVSPPNDPFKLFEAYCLDLNEQKRQLQGFKGQIEANQLPFGELVQSGIDLLTDLLSHDSPAPFFDSIRSHRDDVEDYIEDLTQVKSFFKGQVPLFMQAKRDLSQFEPQMRHITDPDLIRRVETVKQILGMKDPTKRIPELPLLLEPVKNKILEVLNQKLQQVNEKARGVKEAVGQYVVENYGSVAENLSVNQLTQEIDGLLEREQQSIDWAIARQVELDQLQQLLLQRIDQQAVEFINQQAQENNSEAQSVIKPVVSVQVANIAPKSVLETVDDVEEYVETLKMALLSEIEQNHRVRIN